MADPWDDPQARAWARHVELDMVPAMRASDAVLPIWTGKIDAKMAVEIGASVLMGKPLIVIVKAGTRVPDKLVKIADRIIETDADNAYSDVTLPPRIKAALDELLGATDG